MMYHLHITLKKFTLKNHTIGAGEMARWLGAPITLPENRSSTGVHMAVSNCL